MRTETRHSVTVIAILCVAALLLLSVFQLAGQFGVWMVWGMKLFFGNGFFIFPFILVIVGLFLINPERYVLRPINYFGLALFIFAYSGLFHIKVPLEDSWDAVASGLGGGYVGWFVAYPLLRIMDFWATLIVLIALFLAGIFLTFNISIKDLKEKSAHTMNLWARIYRWWYLRFHKDDFQQEGEYDEAADAAEEFSDEEDDEDLEEDEEDFSERKIPKDSSADSKIVLSSPAQRVKIALPVHLLQPTSSTPTSGDIHANKEKIRHTLEQFGIEVEMGEVSVGPTVTQYTLRPAEGVKLSKILALGNDLALALAAHPIRIEAPIPGKSFVGIEVPNKAIARVSLREVIDAKQFKQAASKLAIGVGKDVAGKVWVADLGRMPHLLIAGATGSGKSVCINSIIISLLYHNGPDELKFILVDPKRVELTHYNGIPYLLTPVVTNVQKTINALKWAIGEMDQRFQLLSESGKRDIVSYNAAYKESRMPYIVIVIDELADLMSVAAAEVEGAIIRLAQMARAVGIHLILATQRPSVDVITGLIKANITSRIAFAVASQTDSRTILDMAGAEKLLGRGDMLFITSELSKPKRLQGAFVSDDEVMHITQYLKRQVDGVEYHEEIIEPKQTTIFGGEKSLGESDVLLNEARELVIKAGKASASYLQRRLRVGYARAARLLDLLEEEGVIGPADGAKPREILVPKDEYEYNEEGEDEGENDSGENGGEQGSSEK